MMQAGWPPGRFVLDCAGRPLSLEQPQVVGIVNITPDSFSDGGAYFDAQRAVEHGLRLAEEGADMLDIGGESTRPGAAEVSLAEELARVIPVIEQLAARTALPIAVDTSKPAVMRAAVAAGAGMINDIYALRQEGALTAVAELGVPVCLMHMQGEPRQMQVAPSYADVADEVERFLADRLLACQLAGIESKQIVVDPGFGFGKTLEHNRILFRDLSRFNGLGAGLYVGLSRKSMLGAWCGRGEPQQRIAASAAAALLAAQRGARLIRVHDVAATRDVLAVWAAVDGGAPSAHSAPPRGPADEDD